MLEAVKPRYVCTKQVPLRVPKQVLMDRFALNYGPPLQVESSHGIDITGSGRSSSTPIRASSARLTTSVKIF
jgi:hypothetical protein